MSTPTTGTLAGSGLLRWGTTLSVNPVQKLKSLAVKDKITIPDPVDPSDAVSRGFMQNYVASQTVRAGAGVSIDYDRNISLSSVQTFQSVTLTGDITNDLNAVTKRYVETVLKNYIDQNTFNVKMTDIAYNSDIQTALQNVATMSYVDGKIAPTVTASQLTTAIENLATQDYVDKKTDDKATTNYVDSKVQGLASTQQLQEAVAGVALKSYVDAIASSFVGKTYVDQAVSNLATNDSVDTKIKESISTMATVEYVDSSVKNKVSTSYVDTAVKDLASKTFVETLVGPLAEERYVADLVQNMATTFYVDSAVENLATRNYVDQAIANMRPAARRQSESAIQYVIPESGDTIDLNGSSYLLINPTAPLDTLTVSLPSRVTNGKEVTIATSHNIAELILSGALVGTSQNKRPLNTDTSIKLIYSADAGAFFVL